jgi:ribonuclease R
MTKRKTNTVKKNRSQRMSTKATLMNFFESAPDGEFSAKQLGYRLGMQKKKDRDKLSNVLNQMVEAGKIEECDDHKYKLTPRIQQIIEGIIDFSRFGYAFFMNDQFPDDIFIPEGKTLNALHGDTVRIRLVSRKKSGKRLEGEVLSVVSRNKTTFVGLLDISDKTAFLIADNQKIHVDFFLSRDKIKNAQDGEKAIVELVEWPVERKNPFAKIVKVLGKAGDHEVEMHAIIEEFGLPYEFPMFVINESEKISQEIQPSEIAKRRDFRDTITFTIDPEDAKDFDDAISVKSLADGHYEIGVHIADVSHYLKPDTFLDKEAFRRATSVYLVDRVVPMLPEILSNELCSLKPNEDKLCFSAVFEMDLDGKIYNEWFGKTVIHSNRRFTYEQVQEILNTGEGDYKEEVFIANKIAVKLREKRFANGALSFETEEVKFRLDAIGKPLEVYKKLRLDAHMLIEDLMLLANRKVAEVVSKAGKARYPFVYRVHEPPNVEKLANFMRVASQLGYKIDNTDNQKLAKSINKLLDEIEGKPEQNILQSLAIRSMSKACYTTKNAGHYGLAFEFYTHFTSPIRRYPDVMVHRVLGEYLDHKQATSTLDQLEARSKHCSEREVNAEQAERASIKFKQVEFIQGYIHQVFEGVISGVTDNGIFVELLENKCEGLVSVRTMNDDYYIFEEENYQLKGFNTGKIYKLGQIVKVEVVEANLYRRMIDFKLSS